MQNKLEWNSSVFKGIRQQTTNQKPRTDLEEFLPDASLIALKILTSLSAVAGTTSVEMGFLVKDIVKTLGINQTTKDSWKESLWEDLN